MLKIVQIMLTYGLNRFRMEIYSGFKLFSLKKMFVAMSCINPYPANVENMVSS